MSSAAPANLPDEDTATRQLDALLPIPVDMPMAEAAPDDFDDPRCRTAGKHFDVSSREVLRDKVNRSIRVLPLLAEPFALPPGQLRQRAIGQVGLGGQGMIVEARYEIQGR